MKKNDLLNALRHIFLTYVTALGIMAILGTRINTGINTAGGGCGGSSSVETSGGGGCAGTSTPKPIITFTLTAYALSPTEISLSWTDLSSYGSNYRIYKDGTYYNTVDCSVTSITISGLDPYTQYCFKVYAIGWTVDMYKESKERCVTTWRTPPTTPANPVANAVTSTQIDLSWDPSTGVCGVTGYNIYRDGTYLKSVTGISASDTELSPVAYYCYTVSAYDNIGTESAQSIQACETTLPDYPPATPDNLVANAASSTQIDLLWDASIDDYGVTGYNIYKDGTYLKSVTGTSASDIGLGPVTGYCYTVSAYDAVGNESAQSIQACETTPPLSAPTNLVAITDTPDQIDLNWSPSSDDGIVTGHYIYRDGTYLKSVTGTSASDTGLDKGTRYCYTVSAYDAAGNESAPSNQACAITWTINIIDSWGKVGFSTSIAIDSADNVHISYYDSTNADLKYATNASGAWVTHTIDSQGSVGNCTSIAIDSADNAHISYRDITNGDLKYATNGSGAWVTHTIDSLGDVGGHTSIAINSADNVHISYYDYTNGDLKCATNASGAWVTHTIDSPGSMGYYTSIAIDSADNVHISYYDYTNGDLKYATNATGAWVTHTIDSQGDVGSYNSTAIDSADNVHISYWDYTNRDLKYATNASGAWVTHTIDSQGNMGTYTSIAIDSADNVHISYFDSTNYDLKYATNKPGSWDIYTINKWAQSTSIAVDSADKVHISYHTGSRLEYATNR